MRAAIALVALLAAVPTRPEVEFTPRDIAEWRHHSFKGHTTYRLVDIDGRQALHAQCNASASGLFLERRIDLGETPIIEWEWRVDEVFDGTADERTRGGDDYAARLYVVKDGGLMRWRTRAINYVWSSAEPEGSDWPNPYAGQARMIAVRSGPPLAAGIWKTERRNVREDFRRHHGLDIDSIDAIAVMTDCDDRQSAAQAWYGTIRFLPAE